MRDRKAAGLSVGLVPTMGALHEGHLSLVKAANEKTGVTVVTIFVNPSQFGSGKDFINYPRNLQYDLELLQSAGAAVVFAPSVAEMYPDGLSNSITPGSAALQWEGTLRPGHFEGVATIVLKLFTLIKPDIAFFGQKDYQQTLVIRELVNHQNLDMEIVACPIIREKDGLAMSSRNAYLTVKQRSQAAALSRGLRAALAAAEQGESSAKTLTRLVQQELDDAGITRIDYVAVVDCQSLQPLEQVDDKAVILLAAHVGSTRLIDNVQIHLQEHGPSNATDTMDH